MKQAIENLLIKLPQILIVEDDRQQLGQLVEWLSEREGKLFQARSSEQAQEILKDQWVDAVITDWQLSGRSGLDLIRDLRQSGFKGPLLICTGMMLSPEHLRTAFDAGVDDYLRKPLNEVELKVRLDNALQLYAHRQVLGKYLRSQTYFIQFISRHLGEGLDQLSQIQAQIKLNQSISNEQETAYQITLTLKQRFHRLMKWARFRFALRDLQFTRFEVRQLLKSLSSHFQAEADRLRVRGGKELYLVSDPDLLQRVLGNLVDNALRFSTGQVLIQVEQSGEQLRFMIKDAGENLSEGQAEQLLNSPSQGLGLHICQDLLGILGSNLHLQKGRKGDTQFYFELKSA